MYINKKVVSLLTLSIVFIGFVISTNIVVRRYQFEIKDHYIDLAMPLKKVEKLATVGGKSVDETLKILKQNNLTSVLLEELTLNDYINQ